jgi:hypothetical protein
MRKSQAGFIEVLGAMFVLLLIVGIFFAMFFVRFKLSNEVVSGIAYNTTNDRAISGATCFSVRASEATYVNQETKSTYCVPPHSPYIPLINKAAADKRVKIEVQAHKYFTIKWPWHVVSNVTVAEVKQ